MKIVFFGTPNYILPVLNTLNKEFKDKNESPVVAVVTQKPKPSGRKKLLQYSAVDQWAHDRGKTTFFSCEDLITKNEDVDIGILAAYGEIIPKKVIDRFPFGILNIHPSILPEFRGASPVQATIIAGKGNAGVSIIKMDEKLDHGPIVSQFTEEIFENDTTESLRERLFTRSAEVLKTLIPAYIKGKIKFKKQDYEKATFSRVIKKSDAFIDPDSLSQILSGKKVKKNWEIPFITDYAINYTQETIHNFIRAMQPWPVAWTYIQINSELKTKNLKRLKIHKSHLLEETKNNSSDKSLQLILDEVQLEGKNPVSWKQFTQAYPKMKFTTN